MSSIIRADTIQDLSGNNIINESGNTITIGASGDTVDIPANATLDTTGATVTGFVGLVEAWVNFNGEGTVAIRGSGNVSSITDNGTGDYTINFTNSLSDTNYAVVGSTSGNSSNGYPFTFELPPHYNDGIDGQATGSVRVYSVLTGSNSKQDVSKIHVGVIR